MRNWPVLLLIAAAALAAGFVSSPRDSDAAFHLMRVYGVMGGAGGGSNVQYVELRMTDAGQNFVNTHDICFFDAAGAPYARFTFPANTANGADEASILVATAEFDSAWAAGAPDFTFSAANTTAIAGGADVNHPIRQPAGKVTFGSDSATVPANMCAGSFSVIDSIAYGTGYSGSVNFGTKFNTDLPTANQSAARLQGPICFQAGSGTGSPCPAPRDNSVNYALVDVNTAGNNPRNSLNQSGPLNVISDSDADGVPDGSDACPGTTTGHTVDAVGCAQAQVDSDADTICNPGAPSGGPAPPCTGSDNCPLWPNPSQGLPNWTVPANDPDCDNFTTAHEMFIGTDSGGHCAASSAQNNEPPPDRWPTDFNDNQFTNTIDVGSFVPVLGSSAPGPPYNVRFDYNGNNIINTVDVGRFVPLLGKACA
jgi:hypothetical protein